MKNHFILGLQLWGCLLFVLCIGLFSCKSDFEEHYNPSKHIDKNIIDILAEEERFSKFVSIIDKLDLRKTLGESAIYTCLAPTNDHVDFFLQQNNYGSIEEVPITELRQYVNYHFINGMYYNYDIEKKYTDQTTGLNPTKSILFRTRSESNLPGKYLRIFTDSFFEKQGYDFKLIYGVDGAGFMIENINISANEFDIDASNGVIHVLSAPLTMSPRADEAIAKDSETTIFHKWIENRVSYELGDKDEFGRVDTMTYKTFTFGRNLASEEVLSTLFIPTDAAIKAYFAPYMDDLYQTIDSVPDNIITEIIKVSIYPDTWFRSDIERNNPELRAISSSYPLWITEILPTITGSILSSNATIYKVNKMIVPAKLHSVEGGVYIKRRVYSQWDWMFKNTNLEAGLTEGLYYQHSEKTLLVQPDSVWGAPLAEELEDEELLARYEQCRTGIINLNVMTDGGLRKRFYPTEFGYILYDDGKFIDYTGHSVKLLTKSPVWKAANGAIYEIDGFLTPMQKTDVNLSVYALMKLDSDFSTFVEICDKGRVADELNLTGFFSYTIFAPSNQAIANSGIQVGNMTEAEAKGFVYQHIVLNRYIFSDGVFKGNIMNKNGAYLRMDGEWNNFTITSPSGNPIKPLTANKQASNGVIHKIDQIIK